MSVRSGVAAAALLIAAADLGIAQEPPVVTPVRPADSANAPISPSDLPSQLNSPPIPSGDAGGNTSGEINLRPLDPANPGPTTEPNADPDVDTDAAVPGDAAPQADAGLGATGLDAAADMGLSAFARDSALSDAGVGQGSYSAAPNMTGDLFGMGSAYVFGLEGLPPSQNNRESRRQGRAR